MQNIFLSLIIALALLCSHCKKDGSTKDDTLSLTKTAYSGNQLKLDGYFYFKDNSTIFSTYFFYRNGILLVGGGLPSPDFQDLEKSFVSPNWQQTAKKDKLSWGLFSINGNLIKFEYWYPSSGGPLPVYVREGSIINDTTFLITESYRMKSGKKTDFSAENETYHFKAFSPKLDSTNSFVK